MIVRKKSRRKVEESFDEIDSYALITGLEQKIDELVLSYKQYAEEMPEWKEVFDTLSAQTLEQKGQLEGLRDSLSSEDAQSLQTGKSQTLQLLDDGYNQNSYYNEDTISFLLEDASSVTEGLDNSDEFMVLRKESEDPDEAFLEYHFQDKEQAQEEFFSSDAPAALLSMNEKGKWRVEALTEECSKKDLKATLDEQIKLLNQ